MSTELAEISMGVVERQTLINGMNTLLDQQTQFFQAMMYLGLMFTVAVMFNTMIMNVAERDFELATLRVLGASTRSLGFMLLFESLLIGIIGGLVGVAFACGGAVGLAASFSSWQFFVAIVVVPSVAYQLMVGVIVIAVAMTPIGIWRLRRMDLVEKVKDLSVKRFMERLGLLTSWSDYLNPEFVSGRWCSRTMNGGTHRACVATRRNRSHHDQTRQRLQRVSPSGLYRNGRSYRRTKPQAANSNPRLKMRRCRASALFTPADTIAGEGGLRHRCGGGKNLNLRKCSMPFRSWPPSPVWTPKKSATCSATTSCNTGTLLQACA